MQMLERASSLPWLPLHVWQASTPWAAFLVAPAFLAAAFLVVEQQAPGARRGFVVRSRDADDRRRQVLALTALGRRVLRDAEHRCDDALDRLAALSSDTDAPIVSSLDNWLPAPDQAAVDLRASVMAAQRAARAQRATSRRAS
jgi:hypothetical protein